MRPKTQSIHKLSSRLCLAAVFCFFLIRLAGAQSPGFFGFVDDPTPISIGLRDRDETINFKIPKNLLTFSKNWTGGVQDFLVIDVTFPDMSPLSLNGRDESRPDVLLTYLHSYAHTGERYSTQTRVDQAISEGRWIPAGETLDEAGRSYRHYFEKSASKALPQDSPLLNEFFVPTESALYIECSRATKHPKVGCSVITDYGKNLSLTVKFRRSQFTRWPEFHDAVVRLLDSLRQAHPE